MLFLPGTFLLAQHSITLKAKLDPASNTIEIEQELTYFNQSEDTISSLLLNDWINSYSDKQSSLGKKFSDEYVRSYQFAAKKEMGGTSIRTVSDGTAENLKWTRPADHLDLVEVELKTKLLPGEKQKVRLNYQVKLPHDRFTRYGYDDNKGRFVLRDWFLVPARYEDHRFMAYSNADTDDIANGLCNYDLFFSVPSPYTLTSDLDEVHRAQSSDETTYHLQSDKRLDFSLYVEQKSDFYSYKNDEIEVVTNLTSNNLNDIQKALVIQRILDFTRVNLGSFPQRKITISEVDYERNPFYGLNQLPSFLNVFQDEFLFELKFLKTYLNNYLKNALMLDRRKDNWVYDSMQVYLMIKFIEENHPDMKLSGGLSRLKLLQGFKIMNLDFNEQYNYLYLFMARRNLDQPLSESKDDLIRFNEKIASKYRAGISLKYLDKYLEGNIVNDAIKEFYALSSQTLTHSIDFIDVIKKHTNKDIEWYYKTIVQTRDIIDFTFKDVKKSKDSITLTIRNRTGANVPVPIYGLKDNKIVFKKWYENIRKDSTFTVDRQEADKVVINYKNEVPEFNQRNNWKSLNSWLGNNRPFKFTVLKDIEDPTVNQIIYVPSFAYNFYNGISPGLKINNRTLLNKPFNYDINPVYALKTGAMRGSSSFGFNQFNRNSNLFLIRYGMYGSYFNYAPDAAFFKINPSISFNFRDTNLRKNDRQTLLLRYNVVEKQESSIVKENTLQNYSLFNVKYVNSKTELLHQFVYQTDIQISNAVGRLSGEIDFRKSFRNSRQFSLRLFAGTFLYDKSSTNTFYFGVSRVNDFLFEQELLGRSEKTGIFSQQFIMGDAGFKSKLLPETVNKWLAVTNMGFNIWNWIEVYGDVGVVKNSGVAEKWLYDSGIRLNLVPDYFELYFPVHSNNGWEIAQNNYGEKIRIVFTIDPKLLLNLFTRKWF